MSRSLSRWVRKLFDHAATTRPPARFRPCLEPLEGRRLPTAYTVTTTRDILHDTTPGEVTLRDALTAISMQAPSGNAAAGTASNTVSFVIGVPGTGQTINVGSGNVAAGLPALTHQVFLDGWSQGGPGYSGPPLVALNGASAGGADGLVLQHGSDGSTVRGLVIQQFDNRAIGVDGSSGNLLTANYVGTDLSGTAARPNQLGIVIEGPGAAGNTVGGTAAGAGNVISGNKAWGMLLSGAGVSGNAILGNLIGTDATGTVALGNGAVGISIGERASGNTVGGTAAGAANVISANGTGVDITGNPGGTTGNVVLGNLIGTDLHGTAPLGNQYAGVVIGVGATGNTVGGTAAGAGNVISANTYGVQISDSGTSANAVQGNLIGTDKSGTAPLGNTFVGVFIFGGATANTVGGSAAGAGNIISANGVSYVNFAGGVFIEHSATTGNVVAGNLIGTDIHGTAPLGNVGHGVYLGNSARGNTVGGTAAGAANVISANTRGVLLDNASANAVLGNRIGTDITGTAALGNTSVGVLIDNGSSVNIVGGTAAGSANVISANGAAGVEIAGKGTTGNVIAGNDIGTDGGGTANLGNGGDGVRIDSGAVGDSVGSPAARAGNVIAFNAKGVVVADNTTSAVRVLGSRIFANAGLGLDLGDDGPTPNGANPRTFPNHGQNTPALTQATTSHISGTLGSAANTAFRLEFFATPAGGADAQGTTYLGFLNLTTNAAGSASFTAPLSAPRGSAVTATATNLATGDTSEFSGGLTAVDLDPPTSRVTAPPATLSPTFTISWDGSDGPNGSGIAYFQVYVADNGGPYALLQQSAAGSTTFTGQVGHTYAFYSLATDNAGNTQATGSATLATTYVAAFGDSFDGADSPTLGPGWAQALGAMGVRSTHLAVIGTKAALAVYQNALVPTDTAVQARVVALPAKGISYAGLVARDNVSGYYLGEVVGNNGSLTAYLFRNLAGTYTQLAGPVKAGGGTGTLRLDAVGSSLKLSLNGQLLVYAFDATPALSRGATGVWGSPGAVLDDFAGGPVVADAALLPFSDGFAGPGVTQLGRSWADRAGNFSVQGGHLRANDPGLNLAAVNLSPAVADVVVQADIALGTSGVQFAGLVARYTGPGDGNLYLGQVVGRNGVFTAYIFRNVGGTWKQLSSMGLTGGTGLLLFTVKGSHLTLSFNGQAVGDVTDTALAGPGLAGIRSGAGAMYSDFAVTAP